MTSDLWMILLMGIVLSLAPFALIWLDDRTRKRGVLVPSLVSFKGYSISPHSAFSLVIAFMLLYLSFQMRGSGMDFVFMIFGFVGLVAVIQNVAKTKA